MILNDLNDIIDIIISERNKQKLTQRDLGTLVGKSAGNVCRFELKRNSPTLTTINKYKDALGITLDISASF